MAKKLKDLEASPKSPGGSTADEVDLNEMLGEISKETEDKLRERMLYSLCSQMNGEISRLQQQASAFSETKSDLEKEAKAWKVKYLELKSLGIEEV